MKRNRRDFLGALGMGTLTLALPAAAWSSVHRDSNPLADLLFEARWSLSHNEPHRAMSLLWAWVQQSGHSAHTLEQVENTDVLEMLEQAVSQLADRHAEIPALQSKVRRDPTDGEGRFRLANSLSAVGNSAGALAEYNAAWRNRASMCAYCRRDCLNNIGWCHYRLGRYEEALPWFEQSSLTADWAPYHLALENLMLTYAALGDQASGWRTAVQYVGRFGRVPEYERRALGRSGVDADEIYREMFHARGGSTSLSKQLGEHARQCKLWDGDIPL